MHFHRFMHRVHEELKSLQGQSDPLKIIAKRLLMKPVLFALMNFLFQILPMP